MDQFEEGDSQFEHEDWDTQETNHDQYADDHKQHCVQPLMALQVACFTIQPAHPAQTVQQLLQHDEASPKKTHLLVGVEPDYMKWKQFAPLVE
jgi:hypothetical protein